MARKKQKITPEFLHELDVELGKKKIVKIDTIKGKAEVEIAIYFDETKINKVVNDTIELITPLLSSDSITADDLASPVALMPALILREFTDLPIPVENDIALISAVNENLIKQGIFRQVIDAMNQKELQKLYAIIQKTFKELPKFQRVYQELYTKHYLQNANEGVNETNDYVQ